MNGDIATKSKHSTKERQAPLIFLLFSKIENIKYNRLYLDCPVPLAKFAFNPVDLLYCNVILDLVKTNTRCLAVPHVLEISEHGKRLIFKSFKYVRHFHAICYSFT